MSQGSGEFQYQQYQQYPVPVHEAVVQPYAQQQQPRYRVVSPGGRLGAVLLDVLLSFCTLGIGWLIWAMITWSDGQSPGKKLLGHVVVDARTGVPFDWGQMALRDFCIRGLLGGFLGFITLSIYFWVDAFMIFGDDTRTLHDRMANSAVRHV